MRQQATNDDKQADENNSCMAELQQHSSMSLSRALPDLLRLVVEPWLLMLVSPQAF